MKSKGTVLAAATALLTAATITAASAQTPERNSTRMNAGQNPSVSGQMNSPGLNSGQRFQQGGDLSQNENTRVRGNRPNYGMTSGKYTQSSRRDFDQNRRLGRNLDHDRRVGYLERRHDRDFNRRVVSSGQYREGTNAYGYGQYREGGYGYGGWNSGWNGGWGGGGWGGPSFDVSVGYGGWGGPGYGYGYPGLYSYAPGYVGVGYGGGCTCGGGGGPGWW